MSDEEGWETFDEDEESSDEKYYESPDHRIKKIIIKKGILGQKPSDNTTCKIEFINVRMKFLLPSEYMKDLDNKKLPLLMPITGRHKKMLTAFVNKEEKKERGSSIHPISIIIGEANTRLDREIDKCLQTMLKGEVGYVSINTPDGFYSEAQFTLKLLDFEHKGFIHEWSAKEKLSIAQKHKEHAIELFKNDRFEDAYHRFSKGIKLILSIPIPVDEPVEEIDGVPLLEIDKLKANFYNNLASCLGKEKEYELVIELCDKVLSIEENNIKALYKRGAAYAKTRDFDSAKKDFAKVLELDSGNKAAEEKLQLVQTKLSQQEAAFASIAKKMFR